MVKLFNTLFLFFFVLIINAAPPSQIEKKLNLADTKPSLEMDAAIFSLVGSKSGITLKKTKIAKPSNRSLATFKLLSKKDDFALKVLDKNKKEVLLLGLAALVADQTAQSSFAQHFHPRFCLSCRNAMDCHRPPRWKHRQTRLA